MKDALVGWLGIVILLAAAGAVLCVDIGRELIGSDEHRRWITVVAFVVVPLLIVAAGFATVVRIFTLA